MENVKVGRETRKGSEHVVDEKLQMQVRNHTPTRPNKRAPSSIWGRLLQQWTNSLNTSKVSCATPVTSGQAGPGTWAAVQRGYSVGSSEDSIHTWPIHCCIRCPWDWQRASDSRIEGDSQVWAKGVVGIELLTLSSISS